MVVIKEDLPKGILPERMDSVVVLDTNRKDIHTKVGMGIPVRIFAEEAGSFTNKNGLVQNFPQMIKPPQGLLGSSGVFHRLLEEIKNPKKQEAVVGNG